MNSCKILVPIGAVGAGISSEAFARGMAMNPDVIAMDAGSTDSGPAYLAKGMCKYSQKALEHDIETAIKGACEAKIPVLIGSSGTCGTDNMVDEMAEIAANVLKKYELSAKIAKIYTQQSTSTLIKKWDQGKIKALPGAPEITRNTFAECENIVALAGAESFIEAYKQGADIILCGRSTDTAIMAALPLYKGMSEGASWHGAKTVECGAQCSDTSGNNCVLLEVDSEGFTVTPTMPGTRCTPYTVSAHLIYENVNPFCLTEPSGAFLTETAVYIQKDEQSVRVTGSGFEKAPIYTMKLEGSRAVGYQNISLVGIADREIMENPKKWIDNVRNHVQNILDRNGFDRDSYSFDFKMYGYNAVVDNSVTGDKYIPREIGVLLTVTADTQELATQIAKEFNPYLLHCPVELTSDSNLLPTFAFPFSPVDCPRGPVYEFCLHHVVEVDDPLELVKIVYLEI
ncbi:hypothetical protein M2150_000182 [Lachnospiraceae bacterium PM6-15]|uniref:acyclic terpene utilization AtuA family protein n=1 Tax=Ohessyouella blattaphilus TaxID=2949333 RepID=UPI003E249373